MKRNLLYLAVLVLALTACKKQTFDERVEAEVKQFNTTEAPKRLDQFTTFDSMAYVRDSLTLCYYYTIEGDLDLSIFPEDQLRDELLNNVRTSIQLKPYKERGLRFRYTYFVKDMDKPVINCTFAPEDYR